MLKNIWMNKKQRKMMGFSTVVIIVFIISLSFLLTQKGKDIVNTEVNNYLHEISQQTSYKVTQRVETNFSYLATLSNSLAYLDESAYEAYLYDAKGEEPSFKRCISTNLCSKSYAWASECKR